MNTAICIGAMAALAVAVWLTTAIRHDRSIRNEQRQVIMKFQDILEQRLERHQPRVIVWLANNDLRLRPHALMEANGHFYSTRSSSDVSDMEARADEAAAYFDRKQLMGWIFDD